MPRNDGKVTRRQALRGLGLAAVGAVAGKATGMFGGGSEAIAAAAQTTRPPHPNKNVKVAHQGGARAHEVMHGSGAAVSAPANALDALTYPPSPQKASRGRVREYELVAEETDIEVKRSSLSSGPVVAGFVLGIAVMYSTGLLVG